MFPFPACAPHRRTLMTQVVAPAFFSFFYALEISFISNISQHSLTSNRYKCTSKHIYRYLSFIFHLYTFIYFNKIIMIYFSAFFIFTLNTIC